MYAYISGQLAYKETDHVVIDVSGIGYQIFVGGNTLSAIGQAGDKVRLYTSFQIREDAMTLYGFLDQEEKKMFEKVISVGRIGPKLGLALLSNLTVSQLAIAIVTGDIRAISRIPGIGKRTAERLILELKEKVSDSDVQVAATQAGAPADVGGDIAREAITALMALGYTSTEAAKAVSAAGPASNVESLIVAALRTLDNGL